MTLPAIQKICKDLQQYKTPELNDKLYLHFKGWHRIEPCISAYSGCKALWLEGNGLMHIENLGELKELRCLFLQNNLIEKIENLGELSVLDTLNISNNQLQSIDNLSLNKELNTLNASGNRLCELEGLEHLRECESIGVLDLSNNKIEDPAVLDILAGMANLKVLQLSGNGCVRKIKHYRKTLISRIKTLTYLDDRPVFEEERRTAEAWAVGGREAEKAERLLIKEEKEAKEKANRDAFREMLEAARRARGDSGEEDKENEDGNVDEEEVDESCVPDIEDVRLGGDDTHVSSPTIVEEKVNAATESAPNSALSEFEADLAAATQEVIETDGLNMEELD